MACRLAITIANFVSCMDVRALHSLPTRRSSDLELFQTKLVESKGEKYAAFNNAFFNAGTFVHVPRGVEISSPLRSEEHTSELQSHVNLVCRLLLEKKKWRRASRTRSRTASRVWS